MLWNRSKRFCDINPTCYAISLKKEICKRHVKDLLGKEQFATTITKESLPHVISSDSSHLIKKGPGIDPKLQENKAVNIMLACSTMDGMVIRPGEVFSFWRTVGNTTKRKGYRDGRVIIGNQIKPGLGGGLCNLGNTIHRLVLHSPLEVTEFHNHSDALAPDEGERVPFSTGTSVSYNHVDYRFRNNTDRDVQLRVWCDDDNLYGELRSGQPFPWQYQLVEENHRFQKEGNKFFRTSQIYRQTIDRQTGALLEKRLVLDNHSEVMYDYSFIPKELIAE